MGVRCSEFIIECIKINKMRPFFAKNRYKNDLPCVFVLFFTVSSPLAPFGSRFTFQNLKRR